MEKLDKQKTTAEDLQKNTPSNWQDIVYRYEEARRNMDYKFWEESWNNES